MNKENNQPSSWERPVDENIPEGAYIIKTGGRRPGKNSETKLWLLKSAVCDVIEILTIDGQGTKQKARETLIRALNVVTEETK
ncbi:MAG: hypothetical protein RG740_07530 [Acholeplasmataceae bacterium]|nr:hypothetical protein [Acholeplasmataceae bacterium]